MKNEDLEEKKSKGEKKKEKKGYKHGQRPSNCIFQGFKIIPHIFVRPGKKGKMGGGE